MKKKKKRRIREDAVKDPVSLDQKVADEGEKVIVENEVDLDVKDEFGILPRRDMKKNLGCG